MNWWVKIIVCEFFNYIEHLLILVSTFTGYVSISAFASLIGIPVGITISTEGLEICVTTAGIETYKSITEKKKRSIIK